MFVLLKTKTHSPTSLTLALSHWTWFSHKISNRFHLTHPIIYVNHSNHFLPNYWVFDWLLQLPDYTIHQLYRGLYGMVPLLFGANWWNVIWLGAAMFYVVIWWWDKTEVANFPPSMSVKVKDIQWNHACNSIKACCTKRKLPPIKLTSQTNSIELGKGLGEIVKHNC